MQIRSGLFAGILGVVIIAALASGFGVAIIEARPSTITASANTVLSTTIITNVQYFPTITTITDAQLSGSNHSVFFVT